MSPQVEAYLAWLTPMIKGERDGSPRRTYSGLIEIMFATEFKWFVDHDDNRIVDGLELRREFCWEMNWPNSVLEDIGPCSFLEVLIGLSRRMAFNAGGEAPGWSWTLLQNLELHRMGDPLDRRRVRKIEGILQTVIQRKYLPTGQGGFFPLQTIEEDQTRVELWYQMSAYISDMHPEYR